MKRTAMMIALGFANTSLMAEAAEADTSGNKTPKFCNKDYDPETGLATFEFGNGTTLTVDPSDFSDEIRTRLMFHGVLQKVGDSYAGAKGDYSKGITWAQEVIDQLKAGEWRAKPGEGGTGPRLGEIAEALAELKGVSVEDARKAVDTAAALAGTEEEKKAGAAKIKAWREHPQVKAQIAEIRARKAKAELAAAQESGTPLPDLAV